jgi:ornithine carbamoyltransferase
VTFIGDGACNVPASWIYAASRLGFQLRIAAPRKYQPTAELIERAGGNVVLTENLREACSGSDLLYTDVWVSMGKESESADRLRELAGYQINDEAIKAAKPGALVMHCLPAYRGKEITEAAFEANAATIFDEAENRLHVQKAIMTILARDTK